MRHGNHPLQYSPKRILTRFLSIIKARDLPAPPYMMPSWSAWSHPTIRNRRLPTSTFQEGTCTFFLVGGVCLNRSSLPGSGRLGVLSRLTHPFGPTNRGFHFSRVHAIFPSSLPLIRKKSHCMRHRTESAAERLKPARDPAYMLFLGAYINHDHQGQWLCG
jgi:hypothetical protein